MDLEKLTVRLRPRNDWEAVDLGFTMVRTWWRPVFAAWLAIALPALTLLVLALGGWGFFLFWWLLPLWEIPNLLVLSRRVFGDPLTTREVLKATPSHWRRSLSDVTWRRFNPSRSFSLPVSHLEGSSGNARRERLRVLESRGTEVPPALTLSFFAFQSGLGAALFTLLVVMTPDWAAINWEQILDGVVEGQAPFVSRLLYMVLGGAILVLNPFYIAAGFCIYLNRRTDLEGWDLEIAFRGLASRLRGMAKTSALLIALLLPCLAAVEPAGAITVPDQAAPAPSGLTPSEAKTQVYEGPELQTDELDTRWVLREDLFDFDLPESNRSTPPIRFELPGLAQVFEVLLWIGVALLALLMLREIWRAAPKPLPSRPGGPDLPVVQVLGLDLREESLPDDVAAEAERLWRAGREDEALSLLYRGALSSLHQEGLQLRESFTEADCLRAARRFLTTERATFFTRLTAAWQSTAYAHRRLDLDQALELCQGWRQAFKTAAASTP